MMRASTTNLSLFAAFRDCLSKKTSAVFVSLALLATACAPTRPPTVSLRVKGNVRDAHVTVDDQYLGAFAYVAKKGVALPPGQHRITVEKNGYFPWDKVVVANEGDPPIKLEVILVEIPD